MTPRYAVTAEGEENPSAVFATFEDAFAWGVLRFGADAFHVDEILTRLAVAPTPPPVTRVEPS
jgi:hypothetical protein